LPDQFNVGAPDMIYGVRQAFLVLVYLTILLTLVFCDPQCDDGDADT
jgi:hypothetical protein